jgi:hypothetical protein
MATEHEYMRHSCYLPRAGSGLGVLTEHPALTDAVRSGGVDVPDDYDRLPAAELLVSTRLDQSAVVAALERLTSREILDRIHKTRKGDSERFPIGEYDRLGPEQRRKIHEHIRQLASPRG